MKRGHWIVERADLIANPLETNLDLRLGAAVEYQEGLENLHTATPEEAGTALMAFGGTIDQLLSVVTDPVEPIDLRSYVVNITLKNSMHHIAASQEAKLKACAHLPFDASSFSIADAALDVVDFQKIGDALIQTLKTESLLHPEYCSDCARLYLTLAAHLNNSFRTTQISTEAVINALRARAKENDDPQPGKPGGPT